MEKILILSVFLTCLIGKCFSIQCHQCAMVGGDDCGDYYNGDLNADNIDDCGDKDTHCLKVKTVVSIGDSGYINGRQRESVIVTRGCEKSPGYGDRCTATKADGGVVIKCICTTDGCNSANSIYSATTLITTVVMSTILTVFFRS